MFHKNDEVPSPAKHDRLVATVPFSVVEAYKAKAAFRARSVLAAISPIDCVIP